MPDPTLTAFLGALQLADSAFPNGRYTLSHGLESFVQEGLVTPATSRSDLLEHVADQLEHGIAPADGVALAWAHRSVGGSPTTSPYDAELALAADVRLSAVKLAREARETSTRSGRATLRTAKDAFPGRAVAAYGDLVRDGTAPGNVAVVLGLVTAEQEVPCSEAVAMELYAFAAGWLNAAMRLGVADHRAVQAVLHDCGPVIARAARASCAAALEDMSSCTPLADVMAMHHELATLRLFTS